MNEQWLLEPEVRGYMGKKGISQMQFGSVYRRLWERWLYHHSSFQILELTSEDEKEADLAAMKAWIDRGAPRNEHET